MNHLLRGHAPISDAGWKLLDEEARERLTPALAARKLVDFSGPHGWEHSATNLGRTSRSAGDADARASAALPAPRAAAGRAAGRLRALARGARATPIAAPTTSTSSRSTGRPPDRDRREHRRLPRLGSGAIDGIAEASPHEPRSRSATPPTAYPRHVAGAVELLLAQRDRRALRAGARAASSTAASSRPPSTAATRCSTTCARSSSGPIVWAPGVEGAVVLSLRGGDFLFESGQDLSIGYDSHDADIVRLYLEESFSFHVATPEAAVALTGLAFQLAPRPLPRSDRAARRCSRGRSARARSPSRPAARTPARAPCGRRGRSRRARGPGRTARRPGRSRGPSGWRCGGCRYRARPPSARREIGRKSKIPPPPLSTSTIVSFNSRRPAASRPPMSWASATSPISSTTGPSPLAAAPNALETIPSIPFAPRLQSTRGGSSRAGQKVSISRTGIEEATNSVAASGSSVPSSTAIAGSLSSSSGPSTPRIASAACSSAARQPASQSGSAAGCERCQLGERAGRLQRERLGQHRRRVLPGALGVERHLRDLAEAREPRAQRL